MSRGGRGAVLRGWAFSLVPPNQQHLTAFPSSFLLLLNINSAASTPRTSRTRNQPDRPVNSPKARSVHISADDTLVASVRLAF